MARATNSFPEPLSPSMTTLNGAPAARAVSAHSARIASLTPMMSPAAGSGIGAARRSSTARTQGATAADAAASNAPVCVQSGTTSADQRQASAPTIWLA